MLITTLSAATSLRADDYSNFFSGNGSFEFGEYAPPLIFPNLPSASISKTYISDVVTGWRLFGGDTKPRWIEGPDAQDGTRYVGLRAWFGSGRTYTSASIDGWQISHTPFTPGEMYELSFWAAGGAGSNNHLTLSLSNFLRVDFDLKDYTSEEWNALPALEWQHFVVPFTANDSTLYLGIAPTRGYGPGMTSSIYLDNFSITPVPEPGGICLITVGLLLLTGRRRR